VNTGSGLSLTCGTFSQQLPLLLRDYLRTHRAAADAFAAVKRRLAAEHRYDRAGYVEAKEPHVWDLLRHADGWAQRTGWRAGPSDA
jgi:GrpB-like predicted nucleotidyltransferase (UPF0157 family)